jgi:hypothetical protein
MKITELLVKTQDGLRRWARAVHGDGMLLDDLADPKIWKRCCLQLREAVDSPEFFPSGKWATIQAIEWMLQVEARND